jgi:hypothetical protein
MCGKSKLQQPEKKTVCAKREFEETSSVFPALAYQKLGCSREKFQAKSRSRQRIRKATPWASHRSARAPSLPVFYAFENAFCSAGITIAAAATASIGAASAAVVQKVAARPSRPARDHEKHIQDEEPDSDIVEQRCLGKAWPELVRRPEKKGRRQQNGLEQFRKRATMCQLKNRVGASNHGQGKRSENFVTPRGKQLWTSVLDKEQQHTGERRDAENQRRESGDAIRHCLHNPLFSAARKESIRVSPLLPQCESPRETVLCVGPPARAAALRNRSFRIHKDVTNALSNISLRGTHVSALVVGFTSNAAGTAPV